MMRSETMIVNLNITVDCRAPENGEEYLAGWIDQIGTYVYATDEVSLFARAQVAVILWADGFGSRKRLIDYLNENDVSISFSEESSPSPMPNSGRRTFEVPLALAGVK